jgi:hypothetical protein
MSMKKGCCDLNRGSYDELVEAFYPIVFHCATKLCRKLSEAAVLTRLTFRSCEKEIGGLHTPLTFELFLLASLYRRASGRNGPLARP